jgi:hypothetical protein
MPLSDYPDLGFGSQELEKKPQFHLPDTAALENFGKKPVFSMSPSVVHFGGFKLGADLRHNVSIVNVSPNSRRMLILLPESKYFKVEYNKTGTLAPGMSQQLVVTFHPDEYRYFYDCIRIKDQDQSYIVPLHGYPLINKTVIPRVIKFPDAPLCDTVNKKIKLQCSIPMPFYFTVQVLRPHPYFRVEPLQGVVPAEGSVELGVFFRPITLGTCTTCIKIHIMQHGYEPFETLISARAISGALEQRSLERAQSEVSDFAVKRGSTINQLLGQQSSFMATPILKTALDEKTFSGFKNSMSFNRSKLFVPDGPKKHHNDPVATMLSSTFRSHDLPGALDNALRESLLGSRRKVTIDMGPLIGMNKVLGESVHRKQIRPRGPGSGAVFDAGAQWMSSQNMKRYKHLQRARQRQGGLSSVPEIDPYSTIEGLRIPANLDTVGTVAFVLTQETGKLKPKDLKAAIERNRAEKKMRSEEQQKIRDQGGTGSGPGGGGLDMRSILSEERLNLVEGDAFKRQLREMAFLADVDDVNKEEIEKTFRTSEEYLGSYQLSEADLEAVAAQRKIAARNIAMNNWSRTLDRQRTELFPPYHPLEKSGSLKPQVLDAAALSSQTSLTTLAPELHFDVNRNDVWAKRMNTQKRFVSLVSKWIVQKRGSDRLVKIKGRLQAAGVTDRDSCREFVARENGERVRDVGGKGGGGGAGENGPDTGPDQSVAALVCSMPNQALLNRMAGEAALARGPLAFSEKMVRRNLFPKYFMDQSGERTPLDSIDIKAHTGFDDRTLFQTKIRPEYVAAGYEEITPPPVPAFFPLYASKDRRQGAREEGLLRPAADSDVMSKSLTEFLPPSMSPLAAMLPPPLPTLDAKGKPIVRAEEVDVPSPAWLSLRGGFTLSDVNFSRPRPDLRTYVTLPRRKETDDDWALRPFGDKLSYDYDASWGGGLLDTASGFSSAHRYLLGGHERRTGREPPSASGPTLTDFYCPDTDRHASGLHCFTRDHERSLTSRDPEIPAATSSLEREDILTDSESDDEDAYKKAYPAAESQSGDRGSGDRGSDRGSEKPSLAAARLVLRAAPAPAADAAPLSPRAAAAAKAAAAKTPTPTAAATAAAATAAAAAAAAAETPGGAQTANSTAESFTLKDSDRRTDQVELMRDRKILDMENIIKMQREKNADEITERYVYPCFICLF